MMAAVMSYMMDFYFESAAMILTLITVGKMLEARSKGKTTDALKSLMKLAPKTAIRYPGRQGSQRCPWSRCSKGDVFVVRPGESIPVDGVVLEGNSAVNEVRPDRREHPGGQGSRRRRVRRHGEPVRLSSAAEATRVGEDTTLSQIIQHGQRRRRHQGPHRQDRR